MEGAMFPRGLKKTGTVLCFCNKNWSEEVETTASLAGELDWKLMVWRACLWISSCLVFLNDPSLLALYLVLSA